MNVKKITAPNVRLIQINLEQDMGLGNNILLYCY